MEAETNTFLADAALLADYRTIWLFG